MHLFAVCVLLALASKSLGAGIRPTQIKTLVTFGDSYTDIDYHANGGTAWPLYAAGYAGVQLISYAKAGATCSNNLTPRPYPPLLESQLPTYFAEKANGTVKVAPQSTVYALWIGTNDLSYRALLTGSTGTNASLVEVINIPERKFFAGVQVALCIVEAFPRSKMVPLETTPIYARVSYPNRYWTAQRNTTEWNIFERELVLSGNELTKLKLQNIAPKLPHI